MIVKPGFLKNQNLFSQTPHVLILVKIIARRVPIYKREWATKTTSMVERAEQVLHQAIKV